MRFIGAFILWIIIFAVAAAIWIWSGSYDIGQDSPHWGVTRSAIGSFREHSIDRRAKDIQVPNLDDPKMVAAGAQHYAENCAMCHLAPGMTDSEIRHGLYPKPPDLTRFAPEPAEAFWIIKHGIKFTGMPAWGPTHGDPMIWDMVAYLQKQPKMSEAEFRKLTANAAEEHQQMMRGMAIPAPAGSVTAMPAAAGTR
ncbi:MAG TPA: cytochrome c [Rhodanobacteraceae bacterium]|jgi:mono/diheme cytochrome c family protein|nr:cytochrome c [Rhodanobacteraceae bacterium]